MQSLLLLLRQQISPFPAGEGDAEGPLNSECHLVLLLKLHFVAVRTHRAKEEHRREPENREITDTAGELQEVKIHQQQVRKQSFNEIKQN